MKEIIETLYPMERRLLGEGYNKALNWIHERLPMLEIHFPSGMKVGSWVVPDEWVIRDAWVKFNGRKVLNYKKDPLCVVDYSLPFSGTLSLEELKKHLYVADKETTPYTFKFYDRDWGFSMTEKQFNKLKEGDYEVLIDCEDKPDVMKIGVHVIPGKSEREILLLAHLDHPFQANDNLSGVACLVDLASKIKSERTIKIIICPETIGSVAYVATQDLSNVDFVLAVDICGNDGDILVQKSFEPTERINSVAHCALQFTGKPYRKGKFRTLIGSDETAFCDPLLGIGGILLTTYPYPEYHTAGDTPEKINYEKIEEVQKVIQKIVDIWDKDYVPARMFSGPLMRSRYGIQSPLGQVNLNFDYFFYAMNGVRSLAQLCADYELNFDYMHEAMEKMVKDGLIEKT